MKTTFRLLAVSVLVAAAAVGAAGSATANRGNAERTIRIQDDCDPASFDAAVGPGTCVGDGKTAFADFVAQITPTTSPRKWRFHPVTAHLKAGRGLHLVNQGGEFHTFTPVAAFGAGCVPFINDLMGLGGQAPAAACPDTLGGPNALVPGAQGDVAAADLHAGLNRFQCMIHPWMRTTVTVRAHH